MIDEILPTNKETLKLALWLFVIGVGIYFFGFLKTLGVVVLILLGVYLLALYSKRKSEWDGRTYKDLQ